MLESTSQERSIAEAPPNRVPRESLELAGRRPAGRQPVVLLAEDNAMNQRLATTLLDRLGHRVDVADNGAIAVDMARVGTYDVVLMDLQMPEMDGLRCARLIRQREKATGKHVPIVAVTANALHVERQRLLANAREERFHPVSEMLDWTQINRASGALQAVRPPEHLVQIERSPAVRRFESGERFADSLDVILVLDLECGEQPLTQIFHVRYLSTFLVSCWPSPVRLVAARSS